MKLFTRKHYQITISISMLCMIILSGHMSNSHASEDTDTARLMESMGIYTLAEPVESPDFSLMSINGDTVKLSGLRGNTVLLSFWATW